MEGRWLVWIEDLKDWQEVVPCDDSAVERATRTIYERGYQPDVRESWEAYSVRQPLIADRLREITRAVLRAAGETP